MAKKKTKKGPHRRRRVGASDGGATELLLRIAGVGLGAVGGAYLIQAGNTALGASMPAWAIPAGVAAAGGVGIWMSKKNVLGQSLSMGLVAIGGTLAANEIGLNVPGISGMAMSSNAPAGTSLRKAIGNRVGCSNKISGGPSAYLNKVVGSMNSRKRRHAMAVGSLIIN
jgi:hypothetical protein